MLSSRGLDVSYSEYQGIPLCWRSSTGDVSPAHYEPEGLGWLRGFYGGINIGFPILFVGGTYELAGDWQNLKDPTPAVVDFTNARAREAVRWPASLYLTAWKLFESIKLPGWLDPAQNDTDN